MENISNSNGYASSALHVPVTLTVNTSRTCETIGTELTRPRSGDVPVTDFTETRSMLKKLAMAHGAETAIGHIAHNLLEMTENYAKTTDQEQRRQLKSNINRQMAQLLKLTT